MASVANTEPLVVGLVNNMPDTALRSTERQFRELLAAADGDVDLRLFFLPEVPRSEGGRAYLHQRYADVDDLIGSHIDGLIVTGMEPRASDLTDEPYWPALERLVELAADRTVSTIWSCLAAHAAVLHGDGIARTPHGRKLSGVFDCAKVGDHIFLDGAPSTWRMPHSRYNGLTEESIVAKGYEILSRSPEAGIDMFVKQDRSVFFFLQGHPEYDPGALAREYRRDIARFFAGELEVYPEIPHGYFDEATRAAFAAFRRGARRDVPDLLAKLPPSDGTLAHSWREPTNHIYSNWLSYLAKNRHQLRRSDTIGGTVLQSSEETRPQT